jgi:hypothetical protein
MDECRRFSYVNGLRNRLVKDSDLDIQLVNFTGRSNPKNTNF